jgi:hypothetical protein
MEEVKKYVVHQHFADGSPICQSNFACDSYREDFPWGIPRIQKGEFWCPKCTTMNSAYIRFLNQRLQNASHMMEVLNISHEHGSVPITDLYDILNDDSKLKEIISKLRMKPLW